MGANLNDPYRKTAEIVFSQYLMDEITAPAARVILHVLAEALMDEDWDTVDEVMGLNHISDDALRMSNWFADIDID